MNAQQTAGLVNYMHQRAARARRLAALYEDIEPDTAAACLDAANKIEALALELEPVDCECNPRHCKCRLVPTDEIPY